MAEPQTNKRARKVERIEDWDDARYSVTPPRAALDGRLTLIHFRLMSMLGRVNTRQGWCDMSQTLFAEALGYNRLSVVRAVKELVEWRYIDKRGQEETGSARCHYRLLVDEPEPLDVETCHVPGDTSPPEGTCHVPGDTGVTSHVTDVLRIKTHFLDQRSEITPPLPPKAKAEEGGGEVDLKFSKGWDFEARETVEDLRGSVTAGHVVGDFIVLVCGTLNPPITVDGASFVRQLGKQLGGFEPETLHAVAERMLAERKRDLPGTPDIVAAANRHAALFGAKPSVGAGAGAADAVTAIPKAKPRITIAVGEAAFAAWLAHLAGSPLAAEVERLGQLTATARWPGPDAAVLSPKIGGAA